MVFGHHDQNPHEFVGGHSPPLHPPGPSHRSLLGPPLDPHRIVYDNNGSIS